jgi:hypothetical protein
MARDVAVMFDELKAMADRHAELYADRARLAADVDQLTTDLEQARRPWWRQGCTWEATSPADFAVGLQPYPSAALTLPQALGRFL